MRVILLAWAISGCMSHGLVAGGGRVATPACDAEPTCWPSGEGTANEIISVSVVGAIVGVLAIHVYRRVTKP